MIKQFFEKEQRKTINPGKFLLQKTQRIVSLIILTLFVVSLAVSQEISKGEYEALMALYRATDGENWRDNTNWGNKDVLLSDWYGVKTDNGAVTEIRLTYNNLAGTLPDEIAELTHLRSLVLDQNTLTGPIPNELSFLKKLDFLDLSHNHFSGPIPKELGALKGLGSLDLSHNYLTGKIPPELGYSRFLYWLNLSENYLEGSVPEEIGNHRYLSVDLHGNQLSSFIDPIWWSMNYGRSNYNYNKINLCITGQPDDKVNLNKSFLETQTVPPEEFSIKAVDSRKITLSWTPISYTEDGGHYIISYGVAPGVYIKTEKTLSKKDSEITIHYLNPGRTYYFTIQSFTPPHKKNKNALTSDYSSEIQGTTRSLYNEVSPEEYKTIRKVLQSLHYEIPTEKGKERPLSYWNGITCFNGSIVSITLRDKNLTGTIPKEIGLLKNLKSITLSSNQLTGPIPKQIGKLKDLEEIDLSGNELSGPIPKELGQLKKLKTLNFSRNHLSGLIPKELGKLIRLQGLYLSNNNLIGSLPNELGNMTRLASINLSHNQLTGPIPQEMGNLSFLCDLDLSFNELTGTVLRSFVLRGIFSINLSHNRLSGPIPMDYENYSTVYLDLSSNQFSGEIFAEWRNFQWKQIAQYLYDYNSLHVENSFIPGYMKERVADLSSTQTTYPDNFHAEEISHETVKLNWTPIPYTEDGGHYIISYGIAPGVYTTTVTTPDKKADSIKITGLDPGQKYYFSIQAFTPPHEMNKNALTSDYSPEIAIETGIKKEE